MTIVIMHCRTAISIILFGALSFIYSESNQLNAAPPQAHPQQRPQEALITWVKIQTSASSTRQRPPSTRDQSTLWVSKTEVTVDQYQACIKAGRCKAPERRYLPERCNIFLKDRRAHPMNCVTYEEARRFASWFGAGVDLLTYSEWDEIARQGDDELTIKPPPQGDGIYPLIDTQPIDTHIVSASGIAGMNGSLWEWTRDVSQSRPSSHQCVRRCVHCSSGRLGIGGSWINTRALVVTSYRCGDYPSVLYPDIPSVNIGFRIRKWSSPRRSK